VSGVLADVDALFETAVMSPDDLTEQTITDWFDGVAATADLDKQSAKLLRRLVRAAQKLAVFWANDGRAGDTSLDWRTRVDIAMGPRAWRPVLDLSQHLLEQRPDEDTFESVTELFRIVNGEVWLEGITYETWLEESERM
jgi:hypothetical protein